jgi:hypothetical protein
MNEINNSTIWNDAAIEETIKRMDSDQLYTYQKMAQIMYNKVNDPNPHTITMEAAAQVSLMLRDGLHPDMLDENEKQIYIDTYGLKSLEEYTKDDDNRSNNKRSDPKQEQDRGIFHDRKWAAKTGKRFSKRNSKLPQ